MNTAGDFMARLDDFLRREQDDAWSYDVLRDTAVEGLNELWTHLNEMGNEDELESSINKIAQFLQTDVESVGYGRFYHKPEEQ